jgi:hypothetical protein
VYGIKQSINEYNWRKNMFDILPDEIIQGLIMPHLNENKDLYSFGSTSKRMQSITNPSRTLRHKYFRKDFIASVNDILEKYKNFYNCENTIFNSSSYKSGARSGQRKDAIRKTIISKSVLTALKMINLLLPQLDKEEKTISNPISDASEKQKAVEKFNLVKSMIENHLNKFEFLDIIKNNQSPFIECKMEVLQTADKIFKLITGAENPPLYYTKTVFVKKATDSSKLFNRKKANGLYDFAIAWARPREIRLCRPINYKEGIYGGGHTALTHGGPVMYAGEIFFQDGEVIYWNNNSGHYEPKGKAQEEKRKASGRLPHYRMLNEHNLILDPAKFKANF